MSHIFVDRRDGRLALYLNGELQFDSRDEKLYHEPLARAPVAAAAARSPGRALRVLILGGGDGLALREALRFPEVAEAHVVDRDAEVLRLGRTTFAALNAGAFEDPRARAHALDARDFIAGARDFDVVIYDLTYPESVEGSALFRVDAFRKVKAALTPLGVLAVNAVSPERTPRAYGCVGATLTRAGLPPVPYAFDLPSFREEGYGRWGFFFASKRRLAARELGALREGTLFPAASKEAMKASANATDELLYYLSDAEPLEWKAPYVPLSFASLRGAGPRLTAAQSFGDWMRDSEGRRTLEGLLRSLPLARRSHARAAFLEWAPQAEVLFREVDLRAFIDQALGRAQRLPKAWVRELKALKARLAEGLPSFDEVLRQAYRVFAVFMLVLLLANLCFPDNMYAKGFSSHYGGSSGSSSSSWGGGSSYHPFQFTDPDSGYGAYRYRGAYGGYGYGYGGYGYGYGGYGYGYRRPYGSYGYRSRVYDSRGQAFNAQRFKFTDPKGGAKEVSALLALSSSYQLLETGGVAYVSGLAGFPALLEPGRLKVMNASGAEVLSLLPTGQLRDEARKQVLAQGPLIEKAIADHKKWLDWVSWAKITPPGKEAASELDELQNLRKTVQTAEAAWKDPVPPLPAASDVEGWALIFPGVYLEPVAAAPRQLLSAPIRIGMKMTDAQGHVTYKDMTRPAETLTVRAPMVALFDAEGTKKLRSSLPPAELGDEDRFLYQVLITRFANAHDESLKEPLAKWVELHGKALGLGEAQGASTTPPPSESTPSDPFSVHTSNMPGIIP